MYIQKIHIKNYRNIEDKTFEFQKGLNVIIGSNNSGKTNLIKAITLLNDLSSVSIADFNKNKLKEWEKLYLSKAPQIEILYMIQHPLNLDNYDEDKILRLLPFMQYTEYENPEPEDIVAKIKIIYSLDPKFLDDYKSCIANISTEGDNAFDEFMTVLKKFESHYKWRVYNVVKNSESGDENIESDLIDTDATKGVAIKKILDIESIEADRNLENMSRITRRLVKKIINKKEHEVDYADIDRNISKELKKKLKKALDEIDSIIKDEQDKIGINNGNIKITQDFDISSDIVVGEKHCFNVLDTRSDFHLPLDYNGLGYNNLISIFLIIKLPEVALDILCLEEPEAHLHPAMQYKLFKYIKSLQEKDSLNKQIFVTTHSSNITAVTNLDNMMIISYDRINENKLCCSQLKNQFPKDNGDKQNNKKHLAKFLDVTRSDMLFADKIIFVEGITEKLLLPALMKKEGLDNVDEHISIVEIGGKHFGHFLSVFDCEEMSKRILCLTDNDFKFLKNASTVEDYNSYTPVHIGKDTDCIRYKYQQNFGSTFEDALIMDNFPKEDCTAEEKILRESVIIKLLKMVLPDCLIKYLDDNLLNFDKWLGNKDAIGHPQSKEKITQILTLFEEKINNDKKNENTYKKLFFAKLFMIYVNNEGKGKIALEMLVDEKLIENIIVPAYIKEGIEWLKL